MFVNLIISFVSYFNISTKRANFYYRQFSQKNSTLHIKNLSLFIWLYIFVKKWQILSGWILCFGQILSLCDAYHKYLVVLFRYSDVILYVEVYRLKFSGYSRALFLPSSVYLNLTLYWVYDTLFQLLQFARLSRVTVLHWQDFWVGTLFL